MPQKTAARRPPARSPELVSPAETLVALRASPSAPYRLKAETVERALVTGEHADLLQRYFGTEGFEELRELAHSAAARSVRGGPRVLILPGIMGSTLGSPRRWLTDDVIWVDPIDIARGKLLELALIPGPARHQAVGVVLLAYLRLKLRLRLAGFDADFYPYDWRQHLDALGRELALRLAGERAPQVSLVAHSMGGLVARAALAKATQIKGADKVDRLVMLGTPNYGSFVPTQALRGLYPVIRKIALVDLRHSPEQLTELVFNTFPGLYQLLPAPDKFNRLDLFDPQSWPSAGPQPRPALLAVGKNAQSLLAAPDERFLLIAGVNQDTATDLTRQGDQFVYTISKAGDGTVPLALAQLPGVPTYFVEEAHGSLPNHRTVAAAVSDLLTAGRTNALPTQWTPTRAAVTTLDEEALRRAVPEPDEQPRGASIPDREVRALLEEVAAPTAREAAPAAPEAPALAPALDRVVVGRRRQRRLELRLARGSITEAHSRAYVLGMFSDVTPTGAAQAVDARLGGAIAEFAQRRMFSANVGEVFILPTGSHPLRPDVVLFAGLGPFDQFSDEVLELVAENVIRTFIRTGVDDFATVLIGGGSGRSTGTALQRLLQGFVRGLLDADQAGNFRRVTLCETNDEQYEAIQRELYRLASTPLFAEVEVTFEEVTLPPPPEVPVPARGLAALGVAPAYLMVRQDQGNGRALEFQTSLLTSGSKAAVIVSRKTVEARTLDRLLAEVGAPGFTLAKLEAFGRKLAGLVLAEDMAQVLGTVRAKHLVVVHDAPSSRIPWETLRLGDWSPAAAAGLSRRYMAENLSVAKWLEQRRQNPILNLLLVVNPTRDLAGAEEEGERIKALFGAHPSVRLTVRHQQEATKPTLLKDFSSGQFDVIHYAGHAFFDRAQPARSGILCAGRQVLSGADLAGLSQLPSLVFFNACEAGRIRAASPRAPKPPTARERIEQNVGLAEAFLRGGAANYIGTYWPVGDAAATVFAEVFYGQLLQGKTLGETTLAARQAVLRIKSVDWADYILYGSPEFVVKARAG